MLGVALYVCDGQAPHLERKSNTPVNVVSVRPENYVLWVTVKLHVSEAYPSKLH